MAALVFAGAATAACPAEAASGCRTSESCVVVEILDSGHDPVTVVLPQSDLVPDQPSRFYEVRDGDGRELASDNDGPGASIYEVLTQAGVTPKNATYVNVVGSNGQLSGLSSSTDDLGPSPDNDFVNGLSPLFYGIGQGHDLTLGYVRPLRADPQDHTKRDPGDTNADELMQVTRGGALTVQVHLSGALLRPAIKAVGKSSVFVGQAVQLSASVQDPPTGETLDWTWNLANGGKDIDTGPRPSLTTPAFTTPGTYYVQASVTGSSGSSGESNTVAITVRSRSRTSTAPSTTGPGRGTGSSNRPVGGPVTGSGSRYHGRPGAPSTATGGPASPPATASRPASTAVPPAPASSVSRASTPTSSSLTSPSGGQFVAGVALVDPLGAPAVGQSTIAPPAAAARAGGQHVRASLAWVGVAGILALLLAGAGLERRRATPGPKRRRR